MSGTDADRLARIDTAIARIDEDWGSPLADLVFVRRLLRAAEHRADFERRMAIAQADRLIDANAPLPEPDKR